MKKKIVHIIGGLEFGGAENMLQTLVVAPSVHEHMIFSLSSEDEHASRFRERGCQVETFGLRNQHGCSVIKQLLQIFLGIIRLYLRIKRETPDVVQTWMYQSDIIGGVIARVLGQKVCWGIFNSNLNRENYQFRTNIIILLCGVLSKVIPHRIWSCSRVGAEAHAGIGYPKRELRVIPTGVNTERFKPRLKQENAERAFTSKKENVLVVGTVARWDPQKDYETLLRAFQRTRGQIPSAELWLAGGYGINHENKVLAQMIDNLNLSGSVRLFDSLSDEIVNFYQNLDLFVLSSLGEGVPNVILEAMSMQLPCIVSDVGDIRYVLREEDFIIEPQRVDKFANKMVSILSMSSAERLKIGERLRRRVETSYSSDYMIKKLEGIYSELAEA
jgi:glycosyltransferase involved in cell wall biosynthesis